jgi:TniQ
MATYLESPYSDEVLSSVICRYIERMKVQSRAKFLRKLFGYNPVFGPLNIPKLAVFAEEVDDVWGWTPEEIANKLTSFPYYAAFLYPNEEEALLQSCVHERGGRSFIKITSTGNELRFCRECFREDRLEGREQYWRRAHQLPGVIYCTRHRVLLRVIDYRRAPKFSWATQSEYNGCDIGMPVTQSAKQREHCLTVAEVSEWLLKGGTRLETKDLFPLWLKIAEESGFGRTKNFRPNFEKAVDEFFGSDYVNLFSLLSNRGSQNTGFKTLAYGGRTPLVRILALGVFFAGCAQKLHRTTWPACPGLLAEGKDCESYEQVFNRLTQTAPCTCGFCVTGALSSAKSSNA